MTDPGRLNRRLALEEPTEAPDGAGGVTRGYQEAATLWAEVTPLATRVEALAARPGASVAFRIVVRGGREITTRHRLRHGARTLHILAVRDRDGDGRFLEIRAEERVE